jgi:hypothetical protein
MGSVSNVEIITNRVTGGPSMAKTIKPIHPNDHRKLIMPTDRKLMESCIQLRYAVEHPNEDNDIILAGGVYKYKDPEAIKVINVDGVQVGYKVKPSSPLELNHYFDRYVYLKIPGYKLHELSVKQLVSIKSSLYQAFLEPQQGPIDVKIIAEDAMLMTQRFMVAFWAPKSPGIVKTLTGVDIKDGVIF